MCDIIETMFLQVDTTSPMPAYEQVRAQLVALIEGGVLSAGDRLPSIRQLAGDLGMATNTVQRAYRELETAGLIQSRGRHGTVVLSVPHGHGDAPIATPAMRHAAERLALEAHAAGNDLDAVLRAARAAFLSLPKEGPA